MTPQDKAAFDAMREALEKVHYEVINSGVNNYALLVKHIAKAHDALSAAEAVGDQSQAQKPLTDEQINRVALEEIGFSSEQTQALNIFDIRLIVRAIEAAHGIKGGDL